LWAEVVSVTGTAGITSGSRSGSFFVRGKGAGGFNGSTSMISIGFPTSHKALSPKLGKFPGAFSRQFSIRLAKYV
jgi:hypothetical protein